jgi:hypothetical protein
VTVLGGGTEAANEKQARAAVERADQIAIDDAGGLQGLLADIRFDTLLVFSLVAPVQGSPLLKTLLAQCARPPARRTAIDKPECA